MKKKYELQIKWGERSRRGMGRWTKDPYDIDFATPYAKIRECVRISRFPPFDDTSFRVVQKQGNKIIKVVYPKGNI